MNTETNLPGYASKSNAARALRRIVKNNDGLLFQMEDGRWDFDVAIANRAADMEPENDARKAGGLAPAGDNVQNTASHVTTHTEEAPMSKKKNKHHTESETAAPAHHEVTLEQLQAEEAALKAQEAALKAEKKAQDTAEKNAAKEAAAAKRAQEKAEKAEKAEAVKQEKLAQKAAREAEKAAKAEADKAAKAQAAADRKAQQDAAKEATRAAKSEAQAAVEEAKNAKRAEREAKREQKLKDEADRRAAREQARVNRESTIKNNIRLPGPNSKVGRCWQIIDDLAASGSFPTFKAYLDVTGAKTYDEVGSQVTQTTAYYDYRMYHGVTGRIVEPKPEVAE